MILLLAFGLGLYFLWRAAEPAERRLEWIVAAGFLLRAVGGQALFWISWVRLPMTLTGHRSSACARSSTSACC